MRPLNWACPSELAPYCYEPRSSYNILQIRLCGNDQGSLSLIENPQSYVPHLNDHSIEMPKPNDPFSLSDNENEIELSDTGTKDI